MEVIKKSYIINAPIARVWQALVEPKEISKWGAGPAKMTDKAGEKFSLWGGDIFGTNAKVVKNKLLVQDWYGGEWEKASRCEIKLSGNSEKTTVELLHENVPDTEIESIDDGWDSYYFGPMKEYLENN